jgi:hypothetical protein
MPFISAKTKILKQVQHDTSAICYLEPSVSREPAQGPTCAEFMLMKISAVSFGPRYAGGFCPAEFMLMQISAQGFAVASEASRGFKMTRREVWYFDIWIWNLFGACDFEFSACGRNYHFCAIDQAIS